MPNSDPTNLKTTPAGTSLAHWVGRTWARLSYGRKVEPTWLEINRLDLPVRDLPSAFDGMTIAHLTDFHLGHHLPIRYLHEVVERTQAQRPDLIALTGDFIHKGFRHVEAVATAMRGFSAPLGVDWALSRNFAIGLELRYHGFFSNPPTSLGEAAYYSELLRAEYADQE